MKFAAALCVGVLALALSASVSLRAQQARTAKDGVYTAPQAMRGGAIFEMRCAVCHGEMLEGLAGPPLTGDVFLGPRDKQPVSDLFDKICNTMPADAPGTLEPQPVSDLVSFILQANKFPAGKAELGTDRAALRQIALVAPTPLPLRPQPDPRRRSPLPAR